MGQGRVITDSATAAAVTFPIGFVPRYVKIAFLAGSGLGAAGCQYEWYEGMPNASAIATAANGARTYVTTTAAGGITVDPVGSSFSIGALINVASATYQWQAIG